MNEALCENCGKVYIPHRAYRHKTQACDGPNGYCAGVIDGRDDLRAELSEMKGWAKAEESLSDDLHARNNELREELAKVTAERDEARSRLSEAQRPLMDAGAGNPGPAPKEEDSLGLMHDRVHKDVGRSRIARTARSKCGPKCSCTPGGGYGCACPGCEGGRGGE